MRKESRQRAPIYMPHPFPTMGTQVRGSPSTETMDDDENFLLRYLVVEDTPRYEFLDDDDEDEVVGTVATMDAASSHGGAIR